MRRTFLISVYLVFACFLLLQTGCQQKANVGTTESIKIDVDPNKPGPKMTFENLAYDFGEVGLNTNNFGQFKFTNSGEKLLKITKLANCCGVITKLDKKEYAPGESGIIKVEWNSGALPSIMSKTFIVHSNDKVSPEITLLVKAKVVPKVAWEPERLKLFLDEENAGCPNLTLKSIDGKPFAIKEITSIGDCITAEFDPNAEAAEHVLELKVDTEKLANNLKGRLTFKLSHPQAESAEVLFDVLPKYTVSPPLLIVFNIEPGKPVVRTIDVLNNYRKAFDIESCSSMKDTIKLLDKKPIPNGYRLEVEITSPVPEERQMKYVDTFSMKVKGGETLKVTCNGYYSKSKPLVKK